MVDETAKRERQLLEQKEVYRQILDAIADMVLVKGAQSRILWANAAFREYYGMSNEELHDLIDASFNQPDYTAQYVRDDLHVYTTGQVLDIPEEPVTRHDGLVQTFHTVKSPLRDDTGRVIMTVGVARNITEQKHAQEDLARYREHLEALVADRTRELSQLTDRLRIILSSLSEGIVSLDASGVAQLANPAALALLGRAEDEVVGRPFLSLVDFEPESGGRTGSPPPVSDGTPALARRVSLEQLERPVTGRLLLHNGETRLVTLQAAPLRDLELRRIGSVLVLRDVTLERALLDQQMRHQKLESLGLLAGGIAHDFNNILSGILGSVSVARLQLKEGGNVEALLEQAERACGRAQELTTQLLTFARGGAPMKKPISLLHPVREAAELALLGSHCRLVLEAPRELARIDGDAGQLGQAISNLVLNARQAMPDGGQVTILMRNVTLTSADPIPLAPGRYVELTVRDQGVGIAPQHLPHIFDPFFTTRDTGSGLGLTSVHSIVKQHGGHVAVASTPGVGTAFTLYLPVNDAPESVEGAAPRSTVSQRRKRVLVLDDDEDVRKVMSGVLGLLGHRVSVAATSEEAFQALAAARQANEPFEAAFVDLTMPGDLPGRIVIERLKAWEPQLWVVVMSGYSNDPVMASYRELGIDARLQKPFTVVQVREALADR